MSSLTDSEKRYFEALLGIGGGYVLDFTDASFGEFFEKYNIDIHGRKYQKFGTSKAKKLRAFWTLESDLKVGVVLSEMLDSYETGCEFEDEVPNRKFLQRARSIVRRLTSQSTGFLSDIMEDEFLARKFAAPNFRKVPIEQQIMPIIEARLGEAHRALSAGAHMSVIFLCGSALEAVLLGAAQQAPARFNQAKATPKAKNGSPKRIPEWSLSQLIDVACEIGILQPDIKKFSHGLRDFRNYIHPYEQMRSGFKPDEHTARICVQVLNAALASLAGDRS